MKQWNEKNDATLLKFIIIAIALMMLIIKHQQNNSKNKSISNYIIIAQYNNGHN